MALIEYDVYKQKLREIFPELDKLAAALDIDTARQEAERIVHAAQETAQHEREHILHTAQREIADLAAEAARRVVYADDAAAYNGFLAAVKEDKPNA